MVAPLGVRQAPPAHAEHRSAPPSLSHPGWSLLRGQTDPRIRKAYARHHHAVRQAPWRARELHRVPVSITQRPPQTPHRVVMVLRCPVDTHAGTWTAHMATQPDADEPIKLVLDRGPGEGGIGVTQRVMEMLRRRMGIVLFESNPDHQAGTSGLEPCSVQVCLALGHGSTSMDRHHSACGFYT